VEAGPGGEILVVLTFIREEAPVGVPRRIPGPEPTPARVAGALLAGPTEEERREGISSWFSDATAGKLREARLYPDGLLVVDFHDLRPVIPGASASTGSAMLLEELNGTFLALPGVRSIEYRMEGSCDLFWNWLQYSCRRVEAPD